MAQMYYICFTDTNQVVSYFALFIKRFRSRS